jgi:hypothetical protein
VASQPPQGPPGAVHHTVHYTVHHTRPTELWQNHCRIQVRTRLTRNEGKASNAIVVHHADTVVC